MLHDTRRAVAVVAIIAVAFAPACSGKKKAIAAPVVSLSPTPSPTPTPPPPKPKPKPVHPFTGRSTKPGRVAIVKIDNTNAALPQSRLAQADLIYQELVESGLTRLLAVYSTKRPTGVGPVRSARETDIQLLGQFGKVTLAYSGAHTGVLRKLRKANVVNAHYDNARSAYDLSRSRRRPYSTYLSVPKLFSIKRGAKARPIGFRFGPLASRSKAARTATVRWSPNTTNTLRYDKNRKRWLVSLNGRPQVRVDNVIVQYVRVRSSRYRDVNGARSKISLTVGRGKALLLRDGRVVAGEWSRKKTRSGTRWLDAKGKPLLLRPGTTFILLLPRSARVSVR